MKQIRIIAICLIISSFLVYALAIAGQDNPGSYYAQIEQGKPTQRSGSVVAPFGVSLHTVKKNFLPDSSSPLTGWTDSQSKKPQWLSDTDRGIRPTSVTKPIRRLALVIGNSAYKDAPLKNPLHDAEDTARALRDIGFEVILEINAGKRRMVDAINTFGQKLKHMDVGIFFYAGHGMQIGGRNYLIPVDARVKSESDIEFESVDAGRVLGKMHDAGNRLNIVILDACRNNPFTRSFRSAKIGLAQMDAPVGSIVAYATAPGSVASDGKGRNGIFTKHLLKNIKRPDLTVQEVFTETGLGVLEETERQQIPWTTSTPIPRYYLASSAATVDKPSGRETDSFLSVTSNVAGATVIVDDLQVGKTPLSEASILPGAHRLVVKKEGYATYRSNVRVASGRTLSVHVNLSKQKSEKGQLFLELEPESAGVRILNQAKSFEQGMSLDPGSYHLEIFAAGYETKALWINIASGEDRHVSVFLDKASGFAPGITTILGMEFVFIPAGTYMMGSGMSARETAQKYGGQVGAYENEHPRHEVTITKPFYLQTTELTVGQWRAFVQETGYQTEAETSGGSWIWTGLKWEKKEGYYWDNPGFVQTEDHPVSCISWNDAQAFIQWIVKKENDVYRLPTEAEWEYACRTGGTTQFFYGNGTTGLGEYAWYQDNSEMRTHPVAQKKANGWNLYDMHGNVYEWCQDWYGDYSSGPATDPTGPALDSHRVIRGGGWISAASNCRSANRGKFVPDSRFNTLGFRLAMEP